MHTSGESAVSKKSWQALAIVFASAIPEMGVEQRPHKNPSQHNAHLRRNGGGVFFKKNWHVLPFQSLENKPQGHLFCQLNATYHQCKIFSNKIGHLPSSPLEALSQMSKNLFSVGKLIFILGSKQWSTKVLWNIFTIKKEYYRIFMTWSFFKKKKQFASPQKKIKISHP